MRPIVDSATMRLIEERSFSSNQSVDSLMDLVGASLASRILTIISNATKKPTVLLLAGKGNNGADGYTALNILRDNNISTVAWQIGTPTPQSVLEKRKHLYLEKGGVVVTYPEIPRVDEPLIIIDGIYGAGFKGVPDQASTKAILWTNAQRGLVISIDVPSGVDPTSGDTPGEAIYADLTLACQFPKRGCFLGAGWEHAGTIIIADLPLTAPSSDLALLEPEDFVHMLPRRHRTQNKYQAGSVVAIAGSPGMMGAASLACEAAYTVGAGYVRLLLPHIVSGELCQLPREVVKTLLHNEEDWTPWLDKADSAFIGPGLGRSKETMSRLGSLWPHLTKPTVLDADALFYLSQQPQQEWKIAGKILTPHLGEASRLFNKQISFVDDALLHLLRTATATTQSTIVLKGAPTFICSPGKPVLVMPRGDPGMATAGTGDVLTGMIAGFLAQKLSPQSSAVLATWLHAIAGEITAQGRTSYAVTASALLNAIPQAIRALLEESASFSHYVPFGRAEPTRIEDSYIL